MHREDLKDECGTVDDARLREQLLYVDLLARREFVVEDHEVRRESLCSLGDLVGLACSDERARVGPVKPLRDLGDDRNLGGIRESSELGQRLFDRPVIVTPVDANEDRTVHHRREVLEGMWFYALVWGHAEEYSRPLRG